MSNTSQEPLSSEEPLHSVEENPFLSYLSSRGTIILDGGLASELERRGYKLDTALWSAKALTDDKAAGLIDSIHFTFFRAGADVATTCSYQATIPGFNKTLGYTEKQTIDLIGRSCALAKKAQSDMSRYDRLKKFFIAGSIGSYGAFLANGEEYRGEYSLTMSKMKDFHRPRMRVLLQEYVDVLACETLPQFEEAKALVDLLQEFPDAIAWFSFTLRDSFHISDGTELSTVAEYLSGFPQVIGIGVNCCAPDLVDDAIVCLKMASSKPIVVYPNCGEVYNASTTTWTGAESKLKGAALAQKAMDWHHLGARIIGLCCRSAPMDIYTIRNALSAHIG
jgi:homocysteine S-methyltransferase